MCINRLPLLPLPFLNDDDSTVAEQKVQAMLPKFPSLDGLSSAERIALLISTTASMHSEFCQENDDQFGCDSDVLCLKPFLKIGALHGSLVIS